MPELSNYTEGSRDTKATLIARIDKRVISALDRIAETDQTSSAHLMSGLLSDIADGLEVIVAAQGSSFNSVEDWFARLIVERCPQATTEALRTMGRIWDRAAELKAQEGGSKG